MADGSAAEFPKNAPNAQQFRQKESSAMRGLQRLAHVTNIAINEMDAKADAVADRIVAGQARAAVVIEKFGAVADSIERTAAEVEAALGQISNDPTQVSAG